MTSITMLNVYSKKYKMRGKAASVLRDHELTPKLKVKLSPLSPDSFKSKAKNSMINYPAPRSYVTKVIENNSKEYESAISSHLEIPLNPRDSLEEGQSPLIKILTQTPKCFKYKVSSKSVIDDSCLYEKANKNSILCSEGQRKNDSLDYGLSFEPRRLVRIEGKMGYETAYK